MKMSTRTSNTTTPIKPFLTASSDKEVVRHPRPHRASNSSLDMVDLQVVERPHHSKDHRSLYRFRCRFRCRFHCPFRWRFPLRSRSFDLWYDFDCFHSAPGNLGNIHPPLLAALSIQQGMHHRIHHHIGQQGRFHTGNSHHLGLPLRCNWLPSRRCSPAPVLVDRCNCCHLGSPQGRNFRQLNRCNPTPVHRWFGCWRRCLKRSHSSQQPSPNEPELKACRRSIHPHQIATCHCRRTL